MSMNLSGFRPMKSASPPQDYDWSQLSYPVLASPKVDGIRCVIHPEFGPVSNTLKAIPNEYIQAQLRAIDCKWLDGELVVGDPNNPRGFQGTMSGVMSQGGEPNFTFLVFDNFEAGNMCGFGIRYEDARRVVNNIREKLLTDGFISPIKLLVHERIEDVGQLLQYEADQVELGYEGVMIRSLSGKYKFGRSTLKQGDLVKMKRFTDAEAIVIGWEPLLLNQNDPEIDALGLQRRGYSKDGKVPDDSRVGKLHVRGTNGTFKDVAFSVGSGFDDALRTQMREQIRQSNQGLEPGVRTNPLGKIITYKYQDHGSKDAPRIPIFKGFRYDI